MSRVLLIIFLLANTICFAQVDLNQGGAAIKEYYIELPYEEVRDKLIVEVQIAGKSRRFLFDTGAPTILYEHLLQEVNPISMSKSLMHDSQGNKDTTRTGVVTAIKLGNVSFKNIPVLLLKPDFMSQCLGLDGFIGSNLLRNSIVQFDTERKVIIITDNLKRLKLSKKHRSKLFLDKQSRPVIQVRLQSKSSANFSTLFDSGSDGLFDFPLSNYSMLTKEGIVTDSIIGYGAQSIGVLGVEKETKKIRAKFDRFQIGGAVINDFWAETSSSSNAKVGAKLLKYGRVTIDYKNKGFYFEPYPDKLNYQETTWSISPLPRDNKVYVGLVWGDYADQIKAGDEILEIDNVPVQVQDPCELYLNSPLKNKDQALLTLKGKDGSIVKQQINKE